MTSRHKFREKPSREHDENPQFEHDLIRLLLMLVSQVLMRTSPNVFIVTASQNDDNNGGCVFGPAVLGSVAWRQGCDRIEVPGFHPTSVYTFKNRGRG